MQRHELSDLCFISDNRMTEAPELKSKKIFQRKEQRKWFCMFSYGHICRSWLSEILHAHEAEYKPGEKKRGSK